MPGLLPAALSCPVDAARTHANKPMTSPSSPADAFREGTGKSMNRNVRVTPTAAWERISESIGRPQRSVSAAMRGVGGHMLALSSMPPTWERDGATMPSAPFPPP